MPYTSLDLLRTSGRVGRVESNAATIRHGFQETFAAHTPHRAKFWDRGQVWLDIEVCCSDITFREAVEAAEIAA